jgi:PAS domain S-box-containing protein
VAIVILVVAGAVSYHSVVMSSESDRWVRHTHEVLESLQNLVSDVTNIESSARGFLLTGDTSYIESYRASRVSAGLDEADLRKLTVDNPQQQRELPALEALMARKIQLGDTAIGLRQEKGFEAASDLIKTGAGQKVMNDFRAGVRKMQEEELQLLALRDAEATQRSGRTRIILIFGTGLSLLMAAAAGRSMERRDRSGRKLAQALQESQEQYRMLLDGIQDYAIFMMDPQGQILSWNAGAERIKGYTAEEIVGRNFSCFFPPEQIERGRPMEILRLTAAIGRHEEQGMRAEGRLSIFGECHVHGIA